MNYNSDKEPQIRAQSISSIMKTNKEVDRVVYFRVNLRELFNTDINYTGMKTALNKAFFACKSVCPIDTGMMRRSMELKVISDYVVEVLWNPDKIVGKIRKGVIVKDYYPVYLAEKPATFNWLAICIKHFYTTLYEEVRKLVNKKKKEKVPSTISLVIAAKFIDELNKEFKVKKEAAKLEKQQIKEAKAKKDKYIKEERKRLERIKNDIKETKEESEDL